LVQAQKVILVSLTASIDESFTFLVLSIVVKSWFEGPAWASCHGLGTNAWNI
jgi:hypothetical protein